jgi:DNA-binding MarR family transcriptional regulator
MSRSRTRQMISRASPSEGRDPNVAVPTTDQLTEALFHALHAVKQRSRLHLDDDPALRVLSMPRAHVLMVLMDAAGRPVRMSDLSTALGVTARNVTTIVDGLEREGFVARRPDPRDRRAILLELTEFGQAHTARVQALHHEVGESVFAALDATERRELARLLAKIAGTAADDGPCTEP